MGLIRYIKSFFIKEREVTKERIQAFIDNVLSDEEHLRGYVISIETHSAASTVWESLVIKTNNTFSEDERLLVFAKSTTTTFVKDGDEYSPYVTTGYSFYFKGTLFDNLFTEVDYKLNHTNFKNVIEYRKHVKDHKEKVILTKKLNKFLYVQGID